MLFYNLPNNDLEYISYLIVLLIQGISPVTYTVDECVRIITHAGTLAGQRNFP